MDHDVVDWLQEWYRARCDGNWEHHSGITITSLDNPGWLVRIQLRGTARAHQPFTTIARGTSNEGWVQQGSDANWLYCHIVTRDVPDEPIFEGASGPLSLAEIIEVFRNWSEQHAP